MVGKQTIDRRQVSQMYPELRDRVVVIGGARGALGTAESRGFNEEGARSLSKIAMPDDVLFPRLIGPENVRIP